MTSNSGVITGFDFDFQIFCDTFCEIETFRRQRLPIYKICKIAHSWFAHLPRPQK
jgi:hypothetical protein